jgi:hypothetical protein
MSEENESSEFRGKARLSKAQLIKIGALGAIVIVLLLAALVAIPVISPAAGAQMADTLRTIFGPQPVAELESVSFQIQDTLNRIRYQTTGAQPQLTFAEPSLTEEPTYAAVATRAPRATLASTPAPIEVGAQVTTPTAQPTGTLPSATALPNVAEDSPYISGGWQPFGAVVNGRYVMARGSVQPDSTRPYAQAAIVRIDLSLVDLHFILGTLEPVNAKGTQPVSRTGDIPSTDQTADRLIAAFNGGFKAIHGSYGVEVNGSTIITPQNGIATLAIYRDGSIDLGAWGRDINPGDNLVAIRQNCPLLIDGGEINPTVNDGSRKEWGYTVKNLDTTWRSGIGLTSDGRYLIYAAGPSLTVGSLARALQMAGAYHAMQLDINGYYTRFAIYHQNTDSATSQRYPVVADKLLNQMTVPVNQYLAPYDRDFFYITLHQG